MTARDHPIDRLPGAAAGHLQIVPAPPAEWSPLAAEAAGAETARRRHVVVVDDAPEIRALLCDLLQSEGYRTSAFAAPPSPRELAEVAPDAIVLDLLYNGQRVGVDFIAALRAEPLLQSAPIVICTGASDATRRAELELAMLDVGVVLKPFDIETLLSEIARRLEPLG